MSLHIPPAAAIADVLINRDSINPDIATWAASVCGGHVGRARRLATDEQARERRAAVLRIPLGLRRAGDVFTLSDELVKTAESEASEQSGTRDEAERDALRTALGAGGTGKGTASATRGSAGALKELERRQKSRATRTQRDTLDWICKKHAIPVLPPG
jgi:DNA polymerase-3 subunit delta'